MRNNRLFQTIQNFLFPKQVGLHELRERILRVLTLLILLVGTPMLVVNLRAFIESKNWLFLGVSIFAFAYLIVITLFGARVPYLLRASSILLIAFAFSVLSFENYGLVGDARVWLLFFSVFSTIMLGLRLGALANLITILTYYTIGSLTLNGSFPIRVMIGIDYTMSSSSWVSAGITMVFISFVLSISTGLLIRGLEINLENLQESLEETQTLSQELENEHANLERRSQDLERRLNQIRTAAEISRTLGTILDPQALLQTVADMVKSRFNLYYVGVFLSDENKKYAQLAAGTGEAGAKMIEERHQLMIGGSSMVGWATFHGQPRISLDVDQESIRFKNPHLPLTRSELALPLAIGSQISGAFSIQSTEANAFDNDDIAILQSIADSLAIALENARLFQQFERSLKEIQQLNRQYMADSWKGIWAEEEKELSVEEGIVLQMDKVEEINIPLTLRGDQVIGNISLATDNPDLSLDEKEFIQAVSNQAALAIESARLLDEANKRVEQERALQNLTTKFSQTLDFETLLKTVVKELGQLPMVKEASIHIAPPDELSPQDSSQ